MGDAVSHAPGRAVPQWALWALRVLALGALVGSGFLAYESVAAGPALPGCAPGSGCDAVLTSRWAYWLGVPVSGPAMGVYALLLAMSWQVRAGRPTEQRQLAMTIMAAMALAAAGAAAWFITLQVAVIGEWCVYCTVTHALGLGAAAMAGVVVATGARGDGEGEREVDGTGEGAVEDGGALSRKRLGVAAGVAAVGVAVLIAGQVMAPPPTARLASGWGIVGDSGPGADRQLLIAVGEQGVRLTPHEQPVLGSADAEYLLAYLFDYTCTHCRALHRQLEPIRAELGDRLGIVMLPVPLAGECHPGYDDTPPAHANACELARLGLAVWRADPAEFEAFHHWMSATEQTRPLDAARAHAAELVGEAALTAALADPWVQQQPERNAAVHVMAGTLPLPQLVGPHLWMQGRPATAAELRESLADTLPLAPTQP